MHRNPAHAVPISLLVGLLACESGSSPTRSDPGGKADHPLADGGGADASAGVADAGTAVALPGVHIDNEVGSIPPASEPDLPAGACLIFHDPAYEAAADAAAAADEPLIQTDRFVFYRKLGDQRDLLTTAQLRETLRYMIEDDDVMSAVIENVTGDSDLELDELDYDQLDAMAEGAIIGWLYDKDSDRQYSFINIGLGGGNVFELVFAHGTLRPVAATQDGDLTFCAGDLLEP